MKCSYCGATIPDGELYCPSCGGEVQIVPDYNPLDDVLTNQVKHSIDRTTKQIDLEENNENLRQPYTRLDKNNSKGVHHSQKVMEERRKHQRLKKKALAKKKRKRVMIAMSLTIIFFSAIAVFLYQTSYSSFIKKGNIALAQNDYNKANDYYNKAVKKNPKKPEAYVGLANVLVKNKDLEKAEKIFLEAINSQNDNSDLYLACIDFYEKSDQLQKVPILIDDCEVSSVLSNLDEFTSSVPEFSLEEGNYDDVQEVSISSSEKEIYYTTDGTKPTKESALYSEPIQLNEGETEIQAISVNKKGFPSLIETRTYRIEFPIEDAPAVSPSTGQHAEGSLITVQVPENYTAYYTTDGTEPTKASTKYTNAIPMPAGQTVFKAVLVNKKGKTTQVTTRTYITE